MSGSIETLSAYTFLQDLPLPHGVRVTRVEQLFGSTSSSLFHLFTESPRTTSGDPVPSLAVTDFFLKAHLHTATGEGGGRGASGNDGKGEGGEGERVGSAPVALVERVRGTSFLTSYRLEAVGLRLLEQPGARVPRVLGCGQRHGYAYLLLPFIQRYRGGRTLTGDQVRRDEAEAGRMLAALHQHTSPNGKYGVLRSGVPRASSPPPIASAACEGASSGSAMDTTNALVASVLNEFQSVAGEENPNPDAIGFVWADTWHDLFIHHLLQPQVDRAAALGRWNARRATYFATFVQRFRAHFETRDEVGEIPQPASSLLHGDLWGGNMMFDEHGMPCFIDPIVLYGDREMDVAMTMLFGGFGDAFYDAYDSVYPLLDGHEQRVEWYQLYYLLCHLNIFGEAYGGEVESALRSI